MKKKMKLNDVKVSSFVTNLEADKAHHVKGGSGNCVPLSNDFCLATLEDGCIQFLTTNGVIC